MVDISNQITSKTSEVQIIKSRINVINTHHLITKLQADIRIVSRHQISNKRQKPKFIKSQVNVRNVIRSQENVIITSSDHKLTSDSQFMTPDTY